MDTKTRHALKKDKFAQATASSMSWVSGHRSGVLRWVIVAVVVLAAGIASLVVWNQRSSAAESAMDAAMDVYVAPLAQPGAPAEKGVYTTAADRSKAANEQFVAVAQKYGWLSEGAKARYFAGVTYEELGQNGPAETELKAAAGSWNRNLVESGQTGAGQSLSPDESRCAGDRTLQRAGRQAVGDGASGRGAA